MVRTQMDRRSPITKLITSHVLWSLLLIVVVALPLATAGFGFDSANSCSPNGKMSRRGRAQILAAIPCDLGQQAFCHLPGSAYPWHAVRRFVHENQGLMKRMYGDVRHISILRDEIQNNEVDAEDMEEAAERYSKDGGRRSAKYLMNGRDRDRDRDDFGSFKNNDVLMEPHFRPVSTSTTSTTKATTTTAAPEIVSSSTEKSEITTTTSGNATTSSKPTAVPPSAEETEIEAEIVEIQPSPESNSVYEVVSSSISPTSSTAKPSDAGGENIQIIDSPQLGLRNLSGEAKPSQEPPTAATSKPTSLPKSSPSRRRKPAETTTTAGTPKATSTTLPTTTTSPTLLIRRNVTKYSPASVTTPVSFASLFSGTSSGLFSPEKLRRPLTTSSTSAPPPAPAAVGPPAGATGSATKSGLLREGQLFQDAMKQEPVAVASNLRGVNACPVKDEVVAPFWANNTRGEVLALLNLYPFEQYVHWEKCTHEFKQMFCRDGCRCEQQYRLHRLLAYDPHNECRGIFSDWFRFPSSCICKCYNIPMEFRATSRSPRSDSRFDAPKSDPIEAAEAEVQKAIYEHATDEWYRPRDEFDFLEG
ncbi:protein spaetzle 4 [Drosophila ficusphila]|uniref:protein spaetzle 4 n=1 Tax=Drosophila ficusphila TaxID=30025 RepID=UPI0007E5E937|nr:protein spaetzle 4 [Drosophila ficusphila]